MVKRNKPMKTITNITYPVFALFAFACFALSPQARAVCQDGCDHSNSNTFLGGFALFNNTTGNSNTAAGHNALFSNTEGSFNTASGNFALSSNTSGRANTASGNFALSNNTSGTANTAIGAGALRSNTTGNSNIALGFDAGVNITGNSNIDIGNVGVAGESNTIRIGTEENSRATFIAGISRATVPNGVEVVINSHGRLGTITSSARFKEAIKPMDNASEAILALQPVTFRYKKQLDADGIPQFGLVAEQVEKVNPDLVARDGQGKPYTVRYEAVNAMLLNEFLKEHRTVQDLKSAAAKQEATIAELKAEMATLSTTVKAQAAQLQEVSVQLELSKSALKTVLSDH
jgi:uncharacterized coiled-coil protein SlyX